MKHIKNWLSPFYGIIPNKNYESHTIAPLYDTVDYHQAKNIGDKNKYSFLHITRSEIDFLDKSNFENHDFQNKIYKQAKVNLDKFLNNKIFIKQDKFAYYIYKIKSDNHTQLGLMCLINTDFIKNNFIKKHELTKPDKQQDRVNHILAVNGSISPVMLTCKNNIDNKITDFLYKIIQNKDPDLDTKDQDNIQHSIYIINNKLDIDLITNKYLELDNLYIADGHHRTEAALLAHDILKTNSSKYFMAAIFSSEQLNILGYHRVINNLNNHTKQSFLNKISDYFDYDLSNTAILPEQTNTFGMYLDYKWYNLKLKSNINNNLGLTQTRPSYRGLTAVTSLDPLVEAGDDEILRKSCNCKLDSDVLNNFIINPILNIKDIRTDNRIDFIGGSVDYKEIENIVNKYTNINTNTNNFGVAFTLAPVDINTIFDISDNNQIMPPKTTWFHPKLCDGLLMYLFE